MLPLTLITTKINVPQGRPNAIARPRLWELLNVNDGRKLTLVSAPAGFGKTTILVTWLRQIPDENIAWVSLDAADNNLVTFLTYLTGTLRKIESGVGEAVLNALRSPQPQPLETLVGLLINDVAGLAQKITFVLDDYHVINDGIIHEAVTFFLEHLPGNVKVVISTRTDPPLLLARLRARGQLTELRAGDLRFTSEEANDFLGNVMGLTLSPVDVATLEDVTEGWVAALQLAALGMQGQEDVSRFVQAFSGSNRHVLDFLAVEVLDRQPEKVKTFLLCTSVLGRLCAPLCAALTGSDNSQELLEGLERSNLFVTPLDDERRWYRYHHLFAEVLRGCLTRENPDFVGKLHLRASSWFEDNGLAAEAITHALAAPSFGADPTFEQAARILEVEGEYALASGEGATILAWLGALPEEAKRQRPKLLLEHAGMLTLTGKLDAAEPLLDEAERLAETTEAGPHHLLGFAAAIRCRSARLRGDVRQAVVFGNRAIWLLPEENLLNRGFAFTTQGEALRASGELAAASEAFVQAVSIWRATGHLYGTLVGIVWNVRTAMEQGYLREAEHVLRLAHQDVAERGVEALPAAGLVHLGLGILHYERNALREAEHELMRGVRLIERTREVITLTWGYLALLQLRVAQGEAEEALELAHRAERLAQSGGATFEATLAAAWAARLQLAKGNLEPATALEQIFANDESSITEVWRHVAQVLIRLYMLQENYERALYLLEKLCLATEARGRTGGLIEVLILQGLTFWSDNKKEQAIRSVMRALTLAESEGFVRTFVDEGAKMREILLRVLEVQQRSSSGVTHQISTRYLAKLLAAFGEAEVALTAKAQRLELFTERELEVLALIAAGKSNKAIAMTLSVSVSTVKTHINNLYGKMEVRSRTQALARAREIEIL